MARRSTGGVVEKATHRGTSYGIRFRALGRRRFAHVGYAADGCTHAHAAAELAFTLEQVRRGEWRPLAEPEPEREIPTFHEFASEWYSEREPALRQATVEAYRWALVDHLLPRSEEHTSELQSLTNLVCSLLLEKKKKKKINFSLIKKKIKK